MPKFERHVEIDAPIATVWNILSDPNKWPMWFPDVDAVSSLTGVKSGATFQWNDNGTMQTGTIAQVEPNRLLKVTQQDGSRQETHTFELKGSGWFGADNESRLEYTLEYEAPGGVLGSFVLGGNPVDMLSVKRTLDKVKSLAEDQSGR